jgi:hypothetical protein
MRKECRLRVFEKKALRRIFRQNREEVTGEWRKLHNEELHDMYCSPTIVGVINSRMSGACSSNGERRGV